MIHGGIELAQGVAESARMLRVLPASCIADRCNSFKGSNVAGYDPETGTLQALFNPRTQVWREHFAWRGAILRGKTPIGRTTIELLRINLPLCVKH